jgi:hypothetical protein
MLPRGKQNAAPSTDPSAIFLALQRNDPGTNIRENNTLTKKFHDM